MLEQTTEQHRFWHVQVLPRRLALDGHGRDVLTDIRHIGLEHIESVRSTKIYFFDGRLTERDVTILARRLLADPVAETFTCRRGFSKREGGGDAIEVHPLPGVMNPVAISTLNAARMLLEAEGGHATIEQVQTARRYEITGARSIQELDRIASSLLANDCIETWYLQGHGRSDKIPESFPVPPTRPFELRTVAIRTLKDDKLAGLSREGHLFLSLEEMQTIRAYFADLGRDPTDLELETLAQTWSEHCVHKTLKAKIEYTGAAFGGPGETSVVFENLLKETIVHATRSLDRSWCLSVFEDNAGIIALDDEFAVAFKVETHNHPSAIEPYGGSATGVGGCIRDIMGCGLGAKPIASTDVFCLAPPDYDPNRVPEGVLHPRRVLKGVVGGVRDYGNRMGIPTINGAIHFDDRFLGNPLVFCGSVGLIPRDRIDKNPRPGDCVVVTGGRTGRDGIHGATFSSSELTDQHASEFSHAVQIGNAVEEKKVLDATLIARDHERGCLYSAVTDCGAGGLSSAVGEMGEKLGVEVELEKVRLKYAGLRYDEIWISEAQERMVFAVAPENLDAFLAVFAGEEVEATVIGRFTDDRWLRVTYQGHIVGELTMDFLHNGLPKTARKATWQRPSSADPQVKTGAIARSNRDVTFVDHLLSKLGEFNTASKEWVVRQYDHEVQGRSVIKPLAGPCSGPSDAAVIRPRYERAEGVAVGCGLCLEWGDRDPYWMAILGVDEALRNVICVGADPEHTAILDNFCWPKVDSPESLGALVRACKGATDAAMAYGLPFISGKDSLNNEFVMSETEAKRTGLSTRIAIPYTLLISAMSVVRNVSRCVSMDLKQEGDVLVVASAPVTQVGLDKASTLHGRVSKLITQGKVRAAHDVSEGGLAVAVAEMCIASNLGVSFKVNSHDYPHDLFADVPTTYVLEMSREQAEQAGFPVIGRVTHDTKLEVCLDNGGSMEVDVDMLSRHWRDPLANGGWRPI